LPNVYKAFCDGAILNPDLEEEGEGEFIYNEEEVERGLRGETFFPAGTTDMEGIITDNGDKFGNDDDDEGGLG